MSNNLKQGHGHSPRQVERRVGSTQSSRDLGCLSVLEFLQIQLVFSENKRKLPALTCLGWSQASLLLTFHRQHGPTQMQEG